MGDLKLNIDGGLQLAHVRPVADGYAVIAEEVQGSNCWYYKLDESGKALVKQHIFQYKRDIIVSNEEYMYLQNNGDWALQNLKTGKTEIHKLGKVPYNFTTAGLLEDTIITCGYACGFRNEGSLTFNMWKMGDIPRVDTIVTGGSDRSRYGKVSSMAVSPNNQTIALLYDSGTVEQYYVEDIKDKKISPLTKGSQVQMGNHHKDLKIQYSTDGDYLYWNAFGRLNGHDLKRGFELAKNSRIDQFNCTPIGVVTYDKEASNIGVIQYGNNAIRTRVVNGIGSPQGYMGLDYSGTKVLYFDVLQRGITAPVPKSKEIVQPMELF